MSLDFSLPFLPGDRVMRGVDRGFASVVRIELRAECPGGIFMTVLPDNPDKHGRRHETGEVAATCTPIPPRDHLIRLVSFNPNIIPSRDGAQSHPAPVGSPAGGSLAALAVDRPSAITGPAHTPATQGIARPAHHSPSAHISEILLAVATAAAIARQKGYDKAPEGTA